MATHASILAWEIPWTEKPKRLHTVHRVAKESETTERLHFDALEKEMAIHSSILVWIIPWTEEPDRLQSMSSQRVRHN